MVLFNYLIDKAYQHIKSRRVSFKFRKRRLSALISSVIAKLNCGRTIAEQAMNAISSHPCLEIGDLIDARMVPVTIETGGNQETEAITDWMRSLDGIAFVDVVFVHFEEDDSNTSHNSRPSARVNDRTEFRKLKFNDEPQPPRN